MEGQDNGKIDVVLLFTLRTITFLLLIFFYFGSLFIGNIDAYTIIVGGTLLISAVMPYEFMRQTTIRFFLSLLIGVCIALNIYFTILDVNSGMPLINGVLGIRSLITCLLLIYLWILFRKQKEFVLSET